MKRFFSIVTSAVLALAGVGLASEPAAAVCGLAGSGTQAAPWQISTQADLVQAGLGGTCQANANQNQYYELTADVALTGNLTPLNFGLGAGQGGFDGNGFTISGLNVNVAGNYAGLFGILKNTTVNDLTIKVGSVAGYSFVGGLAGLAQNSTIQNVSILGTNSTVITGLNSSGNGQLIGGAIGQTDNCTVSSLSIKAIGGVVRGRDYFGGLIGKDGGSSLAGLGARINVSLLSGGSGITGGVIGELTPTADTSISGLFYNGTVTSDFMVGGLIGYVFSNTGNHNLTIANSGVRGAINVTSNSYSPAAFIGNIGNFIPGVTFTNNYSTASYAKNTAVSSTVVATVGLKNGNGTVTASGNVFEASNGSGLDTANATLVAALNVIANAPVAWSKSEISEGIISGGTFAWLFDKEVTSILNDGRPMVQALYNSAFWNDSVCNPGYYDAAADGNCIAAALGKFAGMRGMFTQVSCGYGSFTSNAASIACDLAPPGRYVDTIGATSAIPCPVGEYQPNSGDFQCIPAQVGYYVSTTQATSPSPCPAGTTTSGLRATSLVACIAPGAPVYTGPLVTSVQTSTYSSGEVVLPGNNLSGITSVKIDSISVKFEIKDKTLVLQIPAGLTQGVKSLVISSSSGLITVENALKITEKPLTFGMTFSRLKNKVTAVVTSPSNLLLKLNSKEVASQRGSGTLTKVLPLKKGKNFVDVFKDGVLQKRALFTVKK